MIKIFKIIAFLEGISLLLLLFFAMPMKYMYEQPIFVKTIGMAHGLLFIAYILVAIMLKIEDKWEIKKFSIICIASIMPFGTFYIEKKYLRNA
jgi:integral membrane protein